MVHNKWLREMDLNHRPLGYEPNELTELLYPAIYRELMHSYQLDMHVKAAIIFHALSNLTFPLAE